MRISRPCYDKPHRCPGWAGGGMRYPKGEDRCDNGSIRTRVPMADFPGEYEYPGSRPWRFGHCNRCDVVTWPYVIRYTSPKEWASRIRLLKWRVEQWWRS